MSSSTGYHVGATNVILPLFRAWNLADGSAYTSGTHATSGLTLGYVRQGAAMVTHSAVSQTAGGAHADWGFCHIGGGFYRYDPEDDAFDAGVEWTEFVIYGVAGVAFTAMKTELYGSPPRAAVSSDSTLAGVVADQVWDEPAAGHVGVGTMGESVSGIATVVNTYVPTMATAVRNAILNWEPITGTKLAKIFRAIARFFTTGTTGRVAGNPAITETHVDTVDGDNITVTYDANGNRTNVDISAVSNSVP